MPNMPTEEAVGVAAERVSEADWQHSTEAATTTAIVMDEYNRGLRT